MESGGYEEGAAVYGVCDCKGGLKVFKALEEREVDAKEDGYCEGLCGLGHVFFY